MNPAAPVTRHFTMALGGSPAGTPPTPPQVQRAPSPWAETVKGPLWLPGGQIVRPRPDGWRQPLLDRMDAGGQQRVIEREQHHSMPLEQAHRGGWIDAVI